MANIAIVNYHFTQERITLWNYVVDKLSVLLILIALLITEYFYLIAILWLYIFLN